MRVHRGRLAGGDAKEGRVESVDPPQKATHPGVHLPGRVRVGVVPLGRRPPTRGNRRDGVAAGAHEFREFSEGGGTRKAQPDADHRHRLSLRFLNGFQSGAEPVGQDRQALRRESREAFQKLGHSVGTFGGRGGKGSDSTPPVPHRKHQSENTFWHGTLVDWRIRLH